MTVAKMQRMIGLFGGQDHPQWQKKLALRTLFDSSGAIPTVSGEVPHNFDYIRSLPVSVCYVDSAESCHDALRLLTALMHSDDRVRNHAVLLLDEVLLTLYYDTPLQQVDDTDEGAILDDLMQLIASLLGQVHWLEVTCDPADIEICIRRAFLVAMSDSELDEFRDPDCVHTSTGRTIKLRHPGLC